MDIRHQIHRVVFSDDGRAQFIRFGINGCFATGVYYLLYLLMQQWLHPLVAHTVAYILGFFVNFYTTNLFTFRTRPTVKKFLGFATSHAINYAVQTTALAAFLHIGLNKFIAPLPAIAIAMIVQFTILHHVFKK